jgi:hypothetical protein
MNKEEDEEMGEAWVEEANLEFSLQTIAKNFAKQDYILEPSIFLQLKR